MVAGDHIGIDYDPMLAKVIVHASTRPAALAGMAAALAQVRIVGVGNNLMFLRRLLASDAFEQGKIDTDWIERNLAALTIAPPAAPAPPATPPATLPATLPAMVPATLPAMVLAAAALFQLEREGTAQCAGSAGAAARSDPWSLCDGWRLNGTLFRTLQFDATAGVTLQYEAQGVSIAQPSGPQRAQLTALGHDEYALQLDERSERLQLLQDGPWLQVTLGLSQYRLRWQDPLAVQAGAQAAEASLAAPMPGRIIAITAAVGAPVTRGAALLVMEAMKMEHTLTAPADGTVRAFRARVGDQVQEGTVLVDFEAAAQPAS